MLGELETILSGMSTTSNSNFTEIKELLGTINTNASNASSYASSAKSNTATNNTASKTGILSQKLSYLIAQNENHGSYEKTTSGTYTWTAPSGVYHVYATACGGSGGGGGGAGGYYNYADGYGGGSGGVPALISCIIPVTPGSSYTLTVGAGGTGGSGGVNPSEYSGSDKETAVCGKDGGNGGNSSFGNIIFYGAIGGKGGTKSGSGLGGGIQDSTKVNVLYKDNGIKGKNGIMPSEAGKRESVSGVKNSYGFASGAGGSGWNASNTYGYQYSGSGSAGSAGSAGYIKIIW